MTATGSHYLIKSLAKKHYRGFGWMGITIIIYWSKTFLIIGLLSFVIEYYGTSA